MGMWPLLNSFFIVPSVTLLLVCLWVSAGSTWRLTTSCPALVHWSQSHTIHFTLDFNNTSSLLRLQVRKEGLLSTVIREWRETVGRWLVRGRSWGDIRLQLQWLIGGDADYAGSRINTRKSPLLNTQGKNSNLICQLNLHGSYFPSRMKTQNANWI